MAHQRPDFQADDRVTHYLDRQGAVVTAVHEDWVEVVWDRNGMTGLKPREHLRHVTPTAEHVGRLVRGTGYGSGQPRRGVIKEFPENGGVTLLDDEGCRRMVVDAVLVAPPEVSSGPAVLGRNETEPAAPAWKPGDEAVVAVAEWEPRPGILVPSTHLRDGDAVRIVQGPTRGQWLCETDDGRRGAILARHLRRPELEPAGRPDEPERWRVSGLTDVLVRDEQGEVVSMFRRPEDAARAVADHNDAGGLREQVQVLSEQVGRDAGYLDDYRAEVERLERVASKEERAHLATIDERDRLHDVADNPAGALAPPDVLGEHSHANDPWQNALDYAAELARRDQGTDGLPDDAVDGLTVERRGGQIVALLYGAVARALPAHNEGAAKQCRVDAAVALALLGERGRLLDEEEAARSATEGAVDDDAEARAIFAVLHPGATWSVAESVGQIEARRAAAAARAARGGQS